MFLCSCLQEIKLVYSWHPYKSSFILCRCEHKLSSHQLKHMITNFCVIWLDVCCLSIKYWSLPLFSSYSLTELLQMYKKHWITDFTLTVLYWESSLDWVQASTHLRTSSVWCGLSTSSDSCFTCDSCRLFKVRSSSLRWELDWRALNR